MFQSPLRRFFYLDHAARDGGSSPEPPVSVALEAILLFGRDTRVQRPSPYSATVSVALEAILLFGRARISFECPVDAGCPVSVALEAILLFGPFFAVEAHVRTIVSVALEAILLFGL